MGQCTKCTENQRALRYRSRHFLHKRKDFSANSPTKQANKACHWQISQFSQCGGKAFASKRALPIYLHTQRETNQTPMLRYPWSKRTAHFGDRLYPATPVAVLPQKQIFCLGQPTKLGPGTPKSLRSNNYSPPLRRLHQSIRSHRKWLTASGK